MVKPLTIPTSISMIAFIIPLIFSILFYHQLKYVWSGLISTMILLGIIIFSPYYQLSPALSKPMMVHMHTMGEKKVYEESNPMWLVSVIENNKVPLRLAPGLSLNYSSTIPPQLAVYTNYGALQAITKFSHANKEILHLDYMTNAIAYHLLIKPRVLLLDEGTGSSTLLAQFHHAKSIDQTEQNIIIYNLVRHRFSQFSGNLFSTINTHISQACSYLDTNNKHFDLINIPPIASANDSSIYSSNRGYLFTVQALSSMLQHLNKNGLIQTTESLQLPPKNSIKLIALALTTLKNQQSALPEKHIAMIRGWKTFTLLIKKSIFNPSDLKKIDLFCNKRGFDIAYYPHTQKSYSNRYNQLKQPIYHQTIQSLIKNFKRTIKTYKYNIQPNNDNHPFFFNFFKWHAFKEIWQLRRHAHGLLDWGYLLNLITLLQSLLLSIALVLLPIIFIRHKKLKKHPSLTIASVFLSIGFAYMMTEINYIQRLSLYFSSTVVVVSVVIASFLMFSAIGSAVTKKFTSTSKNNFNYVILGIIVLNLIYFYLTPKIMQAILPFHLITKALLTSLLIAPLAFLMGMPFPYYLAGLTQNNTAGIAIAWATNGCASVIASIGSAILALSVGLHLVIIFAILLYALSLYIYHLYQH
jgi:hypothetical protein